MELRNDRDGKVIQSPYTHEEAYRLFVERFAGKSWLDFWIHKAVLPAPGLGQKAANGVQTARSESSLGAIQFLCDSFVVAIGRGLKRPMIRLHYRDQRFKVYLSARGTLCLKTGALTHNHDTGCMDPTGDEEYAGCLVRGQFLPARLGYQPQSYGYRGRGRYQRAQQQVEYAPTNGSDNRRERPLTETEQAFLQGLDADPVGFMAQCSKDMGRCCYCNLPLEDARSKAVGYGPICAGRYMLPWGDAKHLESAPSFAKVYGPDASGLCNAIRDNPQEPTTWAVFSDWLAERGLPACKPPDGKTVFPRNDSGSQAPKPAVVPPKNPEPTIPEPWLYSITTGEYWSQLSLLPAVKPCPECGQTIHRSHQTSTVDGSDSRDDGEPAGYRFTHPCGAKLLIVND